MTTVTSETKGLGALLRLLRDGRPHTRAELVELTGWGRATVTARLDKLIAAKLVMPLGEAESTGGRPPELFAFNTSVRAVIAVDLGATHAHVAITDLASNILAERHERVPIADGPDPVLARVVKIAKELLVESGRPLDDIAGVGIGLPGPVEHRTGRPTNPPIMPGWNGADVMGILSKALGGVPVLVDNDVNLMALGEHAMEYKSVDHLLFVKIATGIGAGLISDGKILRGAEGAAGDIGHIAVPSGRDTLCRCGNTGCLEAVASGWAIAPQLTAMGVPVSSTAEIVALAQEGNAHASAMLRAAGRDLGQVLATCVSLLNPSVIVIGGRLAEAGEHLLAGIRESVYGRSLPLATQNLRIMSSRTLGKAGILGASVIVVDQLMVDGGLSHLL